MSIIAIRLERLKHANEYFQDSAPVAQADGDGGRLDSRSDAPRGYPHRTSVLQDGSRGSEPVEDLQPSIEEAGEEEYLRLYHMARQLLAAAATPDVSNERLPLSGATKGTVEFVDSLTSVLEVILNRAAAPGRARSIALTKLDEFLMWAKRAITGGE